ncbi:MAG TPA: type II toxin-antitoxin system VapC family toxin [Rhodoferax sp.]
MTAQRMVLDTDVVIDLLKKKPDVVAQFLAFVESKTIFLVSPVVVAEIYAGAFEREHKAIEAFFRLCQQVDLDGETGRTAGLYAKRFSKAFQGISLEDFLLAATARGQQCPLWTHNRKHYPMDDVVLFGT